MISDYDAYLLFSEVTSIRGIHMINENNLNPPVQPMQNKTYMKNVIGLSFDYKRQRIFYSDIQRSEIGSISLNGSHFKILARSKYLPKACGYVTKNMKVKKNKLIVNGDCKPILVCKDMFSTDT